MASWDTTCEDVDIRPGGGDYDGPPIPTHNEWWRDGPDPRAASVNLACIECGGEIETARLRLGALTCSLHAPRPRC